MRVTLCQRASTVGDTKANLAQALADLDEHGPTSDLMLFPELFLTGYNAGEAHRELALETDGSVLGELAQAAAEHGVSVLVGAPRASKTSEAIHNTAFLLTSGGERYAYDKVHLPTFDVFEEGLFFTPGDRGLIVELEDLTLGIAICYDLFFPEITKDLALRGADVIATISAGPVASTPYFEAVLPARALETTSFVLYCNLVGTQDGITFGGGSQVISPLGETLGHAPDEEEATLSCEIDLDDIDRARGKRPALRDTRTFGRRTPDPDEVPWPTSREELDGAEGA